MPERVVFERGNWVDWRVTVVERLIQELICSLTDKKLVTFNSNSIGTYSSYVGIFGLYVGFRHMQNMRFMRMVRICRCILMANPIGDLEVEDLAHNVAEAQHTHWLTPQFEIIHTA